MSSSGCGSVRIVPWLVVLKLPRACSEEEKLRRTSYETGGTEMSLEMLSEVIAPSEELAACFDRAFVRTFLSMGAAVTFEMFHTFETFTAVTDVKLVGGGNDERGWAGVACSTTRSGSGDGSGHRARSTVQHRSKAGVVVKRGPEGDHAVATMTRHGWSTVVRVDTGGHKVIGRGGGVDEARPRPTLHDARRGGGEEGCEGGSLG